MNKIKKLISDYEKTRDPFVQIGILGQMLFEIKRLSKELGIPRYASKINASRRSCLPILESCLPEIWYN